MSVEYYVLFYFCVRQTSNYNLPLFTSFYAVVCQSACGTGFIELRNGAY